MDAIAVDGLRKRHGDVNALDGVSFSVRKGEIFGLRDRKLHVSPGAGWAPAGLRLGYVFALMVVTAASANWSFRVYQRSL